MNYKYVSFLLCLLCIGGFVCSQDITWVYEPVKALEISKETGKPVFVDVFTTWCSWCKKLDSETFVDPAFVEVAANFVLLKVDGDKYPQFKNYYQIKGYPTMLFLDGDGAQIHDRVVGFVSAAKLVPVMKEALPKAVRELSWFKVPQDAFAQAQAQGKPIFCDVFTTWCSWCKKLDSETFSHSTFIEESSRFVLLKVDGDIYKSFIQKYTVKGYPTMLFLNGDEEEIYDRVVGFRSAATLVPIMKNVSSRSLNWLTDPAQAAMQAEITGKPIFTDVSMQGCKYCIKLEQETFTDQTFIDVAQSFVLLKVMKEVNTEFIDKYGIMGYPTLLFLNPAGEETHPRILGFRTAVQLVPVMEAVLQPLK